MERKQLRQSVWSAVYPDKRHWPFCMQLTQYRLSGTLPLVHFDALSLLHFDALPQAPSLTHPLLHTLLYAHTLMHSVSVPPL